MNLKTEFKFSHTFIYLISAPVLLSLYYYHNTPDQFLKLFPGIHESAQSSVYQQYWKFFVFFILLGLCPFLYLIVFVKKPLSDFGLGMGNYRTGLKLVLLLIPFVIAPLIWIAAHLPDIKNEYPMARIFFQDNRLFWQYELVYILFYYLAWEFFFRGFLLFGLAKECGALQAILIQTVSSCLIHLGKPESETLGSIPVGIIFGIIALQTQSIWYVWILHFSIGVLTDFFVLKQAGVIF